MVILYILKDRYQKYFSTTLTIEQVEEMDFSSLTIVKRMLSTGFLDSNKNIIFEGDYLTITVDKSHFKKLKATQDVVFVLENTKGDVVFEMSDIYKSISTNSKVIGNYFLQKISEKNGFKLEEKVIENLSQKNKVEVFDDQETEVFF